MKLEDLKFEEKKEQVPSQGIEMTIKKLESVETQMD